MDPRQRDDDELRIRGIVRGRNDPEEWLELRARAAPYLALAELQGRRYDPEHPDALVRHLPGLHDQSKHGRPGLKGAAKKLVKDVVGAVSGSDRPRMADLLDGDDDTKGAALRRVFEGQFGKLNTKVTRAGGGAGQMFVEGDIHDRRGRKVGNFARSFGRHDDEVYANHDVIEIDRKVQGSGFASAFNGNAIDWYRQSGVDAVYLHANDDVGGYAWASQGYDFTNGRSAETNLDYLRDTVATLRAGKSKNRFGETVPRKLRNAPDLDSQLSAAEELLARADRFEFGQPGYPTAYEISQVGRRQGAGKADLWLGKDTMLGSSWQGVLRLTANA